MFAQNLNQARHFIDTALLVMKLNITRNMSHDSALLTVTPEIENDNNPIAFNSSQPARNSPKLTLNRKFC